MMVTAKAGFVTPANVFAEGEVKATKDIRAVNFVYGAGMNAGKNGVTSDGLIHSKQDIKADNVVLGVKGVRSNVDVIADKNLVAKKETQTESLTVTKDAKVLKDFSVVGSATLGTATVKGKLYVGNRAISDIVTSMETDMAKMRSELAETRESLKMLMEQSKA